MKFEDIKNMDDSHRPLFLKFMREMEASIGRKIKDSELDLVYDLFNKDITSGLAVCTNCRRQFDMDFDLGVISEKFTLCKECYLKEKSPEIVEHRNKHLAGQEELDAKMKKLFEDARKKGLKLEIETPKGAVFVTPLECTYCRYNGIQTTMGAIIAEDKKTNQYLHNTNLNYLCHGCLLKLMEKTGLEK